MNTPNTDPTLELVAIVLVAGELDEATRPARRLPSASELAAAGYDSPQEWMAAEMAQDGELTVAGVDRCCRTPWMPAAS
ncbi:MAG: hypothetical protein M3Q82_08760 [Actinomycetota bacterium]|nr:hypothetical protein [Actinomycetota bacterium]